MRYLIICAIPYKFEPIAVYWVYASAYLREVTIAFHNSSSVALAGLYGLYELASAIYVFPIHDRGHWPHRIQQVSQED
jgi:hypothetical protein